MITLEAKLTTGSGRACSRCFIVMFTVSDLKKCYQNSEIKFHFRQPCHAWRTGVGTSLGHENIRHCQY